MPRIPDLLLESVGFLYPSEAAARSGERAGGTAFLVEVVADGDVATVVVTNTHVAAGGCSTLRLNKLGSELHVFEIADWVFHPDGDDVAVAKVDLPGGSAVSAINWREAAAAPSRLAGLNAGVGDEVVMIGRFVAQDNRVRNTPLARFGNIAMMPTEPVVDGRGMKVEAFLVEMRSLSGFSGSPVFIYMGPGTYRGDGRTMPFYSETIGLIGIDTGHKSTTLEIRDAAGNPTEYTGDLNTGIAIVAPVWKIGEALSEVLGATIKWGS